jgi:hypothetical protein
MATFESIVSRRTLSPAARRDPLLLAAARAAHADARHGDDARLWAGICPECAEALKGGR